MRPLLPLLAMVAVALGSCGGSPSPRTLADVDVLPGKGATEYRATGDLTADSGLRPARHGFGFANYGDEEPVTNLTPAAVEQLFGPVVCASGTRAGCKLIPPARAWMEAENNAMAAGHCFGMAAAAAQFHLRQLEATRFGDRTPPSLPLDGNAPLQRTLAQLNALQELPSERSRAVAGTPNQILDRLVKSLKPGGTPYVLGLFRPESGGGHAVTPFAVEDRGDDRFAVLVYDNNYPEQTRAVSFDRRANAWKFVAQANPDAPGQLYSGVGAQSNLALFPAARQTGYLPCPFCLRTDKASRGTGPAMNEIALEGDPENHSHLRITDRRGRRTGYVGGRIVNEIPGAQVVKRLNAVQSWRLDTEPVYHVPAALDITVTVDGARLRGPVRERLEIIGPGDRVEVAGIALRRGEEVSARVAADGSRVDLTIDPRHDETPLLKLGVEGHPTSWDFTLRAHRLKGGSTLGLRLDRERQELDIDTRGVKDTSDVDLDVGVGVYDVGFGVYDVRVDRMHRDGTTTFRRDDLRIPRGTFARLAYGSFDDRHRRLKLVEELADGRTKTLRITG